VPVEAGSEPGTDVGAPADPVLPVPVLPARLPPEVAGWSEPGAGTAIGPPAHGSARFAPVAIWMTNGVVLSSIAPGAMSGQEAVPSTTVMLASGGMTSVPVTLLNGLSVAFRREKKT
jgi:hypothetical protein